MSGPSAAESEVSLPALVRRALAEDVGPGDATAALVIAAETRARAAIRAKQEGVLSGLAAAREVFRQLDPGVRVEAQLADGERFGAGETVVTLEGPGRVIVTGERVALNFLQRLSGVATLTARFVERLAGTGVELLDTRKTTPGLRALEKEAVRHGGGTNHRHGLYDAIMIKENHGAAAGGLEQAIRRAREGAPGMGRTPAGGPVLPIIVETRTLAEVALAARAGVTRVLLDNFTPEAIAEAIEIVQAVAPGLEIEASGGITLENIRAHALPGVTCISVGALTHSAPAIDLGLDLVPEAAAGGDRA